MNLFKTCDYCAGGVFPWQWSFVKKDKYTDENRYSHPWCCLGDKVYEEFKADPKKFIWRATSTNTEKERNMLGIVYWAFAGVVAVGGIIAAATIPIVHHKTVATVAPIIDTPTGPDAFNYCGMVTANQYYVWPARTDATCHIEDCHICTH